MQRESGAVSQLGLQRQEIGSAKQVCVQDPAYQSVAGCEVSVGPALRATGPKGRRAVSQLYKAYCNINFATQSADGSRAMPIKRIGPVEVRLVEFAGSGKEDDPEVWLELYRHDTDSSIDSYLCDDLDEAEPVLEYLISSAQSSGPSPTLG
jgi:hypothetical protein